MKLTLMAAISIDGFITKHDTPGSGFTSAEDKQFFNKAICEFDCLLFGRGTYRHSSAWISERLRPGQLKVVLTRDPGKYKAEQKPGELEFTSESPQSIARSLEARGFRNGCVLGGGQIYGLFLREKIVDELWLTLEPLLFGKGVKLAETALDIRAELFSLDKLNASTLLLKYRPVEMASD